MLTHCLIYVFSLQSPQTPRSFGHQSPTTTSIRSPAYVGQQQQQQQQPPNPQTAIRLNIGGGYSPGPGTPRPQFQSDTVRPTVYGPLPGSVFGPNTNQSFAAAVAVRNQEQQQFQQVQQQQQQPIIQENNRQLRDLLQRQQVIAPNMPIGGSQQQPGQVGTVSPRWNADGTQILDEQQMPLVQQQQQHQLVQQQQQQQQHPLTGDSNTFRQPLPPGMISRPQRHQLPAGTIVRSGQIVQHPPRNILLSGDLRQRFVRPVVSGMVPGAATGQQLPMQQQQFQQPQQQQFQAINPRLQMQQPIGQSININQQELQLQRQQQLLQQQQQQQQLLQNDGQQRFQQMHVAQIQQQQPPNTVTLVAPPLPSTTITNSDQTAVPAVMTAPNTGAAAIDPDAQEIPDNVTAELEKLEDENDVMGQVEGVGDILGDLGEDDDDELFNSLTAEMGADFNILEYADPELDTLNDGEKANLLDSLDFGEDEPDKVNVKKEPHNAAGVIATGATNIDSGIQKAGTALDESQLPPGQVTNVQQQQLLQQSERNPNMQQKMHLQNVQMQPGTDANQMPNQGPVLSGQLQQQQQQQQQLQQQHLQNTIIQQNRLKALQQAQINPAKLQQIQQQMLQQVRSKLDLMPYFKPNHNQFVQVQQAAAIGQPMPIGTQLLSKDGHMGTVTANNNITVSPAVFNRK